MLKLVAPDGILYVIKDTGDLARLTSRRLKCAVFGPATEEEPEPAARLGATATRLP